MTSTGSAGRVPPRRSVRLARTIAFGATVLLALSLSVAVGGPASAAASSALTRYPYLTDSTQTSMTINWATNTSATTGTVQWGPAGGSCAATTTMATRTSFTVVTTPEYQWKATIPVSPDTAYCYRVLLAGTDLLGTDLSPQFTSQVAAGSTTPFSFAVFGDWGQAYAGGVNVDQTNVMQQIASSGARFAVMTGDTGYPGGGQKEYGDLQQAGTDMSTVFGPTFWTVPGRSVPVYNVTGNHGFTAGAVQLLNWPEQNAAAASGGKYLMEPYGSFNGSTPTSYPSAWYAVDAGNTRLYMLEGAWADGAPSLAFAYPNDQLAHWQPGAAEYEWLKADLAAHPNAVKMAFWHYPLFADSSGQPSDTFLQGGTGTLQGLLNENNVAIVFNGHAHGYERNAPDAAGMVSYVVGNGGAALGQVSGCSTFDKYAIGAGGTHCGAGPAGLTNSQVYGFVKVTVNGRQVTVTPTSSLGNTYDVQTYTVPSNETDSTPPSVPTNLAATASGRGQVDLSWTSSTDNVGVTGYLVYRDGKLVTSLTGTGTAFSDTTVAPATTYTYQVSAIDAAGNESAKQVTGVPATTPGPADTQAPTLPGNLTASAPSSSTVNLSWTASSDDVRVLGYNIYRNGVQLKSAPDDATTFQDESAAPGTAYTYQVEAFDAAGNRSTRNSVTVTTPAGAAAGLTFAPTADATIDSSNPAVNFGTTSRITVDSSPANDFLLKFSVSGTGAGTTCPIITGAKLRLTVGNTTNDNSVMGGDFRGTDSNWTENLVTWNNAPASMTGPPIASITTPVALNTPYLVDVSPLVTGNSTFSIRATGNNADGARYYSRDGNASTLAPELEVTCSAGAADTAPPSKPGTPTQTAVSATTSDITWAASTDNVGVVAYRVFRDGTMLTQLAGDVTAYHDTGLSPQTAYRYTIKAVDAAGNASAESGSLTVTTPAGGDTTKPSTPTGLTAGTTTPSTVPLSWAASTDDVGVTGYEVTRNAGSTPGTTVVGTVTSTTFTDTGRTPNTTYTYTVQAVDAAGNRSAASAPLTVTTPAGADTTKPSTPTGLTTGTTTPSTVPLSWAASTDDVGVTGYEVTRNTGTTPGTTVVGTTVTSTTFTDTGRTPNTTYTYTVQAVDAAGNRSTASTPSTAITAPSTLTVAPTDDATIDSTNPTTNVGLTNRITVDTSPANDFLVKFTITGTGTGTGCPTITGAKLRLTVGNTTNDNSVMGGDFRGAVGTPTWTENLVTWNTAPASMTGPPLASITTPVALGTAYLVDVSPLVTGNGIFSIRASGNNADGARYYSRNGNAATLAPQLQITCG